MQQDMEQFTAISTLRGIMFLSRGNVYHGSSEFARFHHFEKMLFIYYEERKFLRKNLRIAGMGLQGAVSSIRVQGAD